MTKGYPITRQTHSFAGSQKREERDMMMMLQMRVILSIGLEWTKKWPLVHLFHSTKGIPLRVSQLAILSLMCMQSVQERTTL